MCWFWSIQCRPLRRRMLSTGSFGPSPPAYSLSETYQLTLRPRARRASPPPPWSRDQIWGKVGSQTRRRRGPSGSWRRGRRRADHHGGLRMGLTHLDEKSMCRIMEEDGLGKGEWGCRVNRDQQHTQTHHTLMPWIKRDYPLRHHTLCI